VTGPAARSDRVASDSVSRRRASDAGRSAALGFDGKWVLHPDQIAAANEVFSPRQDDYDHAELILDTYDYYTSAEGGAKGAVMLGDEMIDEASRKMALVVSAKGRAAGMQRTKSFEKR
jgi:citrate lyase subunit beta/citryl-CoA lyase